MRFFYATLLVLISNSIFAQLQPDIIPLESNPVLQQLEAQKSAFRLEADAVLQNEIGNSSNRNVGDPCVDFFNFENRYDNGDNLYVQSGEEIRICVTQSLVDSFACANCDDLEFGAGVLSEGEPCIFFTAFDVAQLENESLELIACDTANNECTSFNYTLNIFRKDASITEPTRSVTTENSIELCLNTINLPGSSRRYSYGEHDLRLAFLPYSADSCINYTARRFAEIDTVVIRVKDENCITDTHFLPVKIIGDTLDITNGFFDDFSSPGPHPDGARWLDDDVFINDNFTHNPPSRGVATFDGLNYKGSPRGGGFGRSDYLTSGYLDLSSFTENDDLHLSFYIQPKGLGFIPEGQDSLILEFKDDVGSWVKMAEFVNDSIGSIFDTLPFMPRQIFTMDDDDFLYDGFQFRFVNYDNRRGIVDIWNLDYVLLENKVPGEGFDDMAFVQPLGPILRNYEAMPYNQFEGFEDQELFDEIIVKVKSHFPGTTALNGSNISIKETTSGVVLPLDTDFTSSDNFDPGELRTENVSIQSDRSDLVTDMQANFNSGSDYSFELMATLTSSETQNSDFPDVAQNDNATSITHFSNYFAHDDGSAEFGIKTTVPNSRIAVEYTANVADSIRAIQMHFPHISPVPYVEFQLMIWEGSLDSDPIYVSPVLEPFFPDNALDTFQAFTTYRLTDELFNFNPIGISAGKFFIGWEQISSQNHQVQVGFDRHNQDAGVFNSFFNGNNWVPIADDGAIMIRPVLGSGTPNSTAVTDVQDEPGQLLLYPNPASQILFSKLENGNYEQHEVEIFTVSGQRVYSGALKHEIELSNFENGLYLFHLKNIENGNYEVYRFVVQKGR